MANSETEIYLFYLIMEILYQKIIFVQIYQYTFGRKTNEIEMLLD